MNKQQVEAFFKDKDVPCPLTDRLITAGYRQKGGGYIAYAQQCGIDNPTQYWHLMTSWCARRPNDAPFGKQIQCGELLFWMAEVSGAVSREELTKLYEVIVRDYLNDRRSGNRKIQEVCFDRIAQLVEHPVP